jgi:HK97 family phage major capsid protein
MIRNAISKVFGAPSAAQSEPLEVRGANGGTVSPAEEANALRAERDTLKAEARSLSAKFREKRELTPEENNRVTSIESRLGEIDARLTTVEAMVQKDPAEDQAMYNNNPNHGKQTRSLEDRLAAIEEHFRAQELRSQGDRLNSLEGRFNNEPIQRRTAPVHFGQGVGFTSDLDDKAADRMHSEAFAGWCGAPSGLTTRSQGEAMKRLGISGFSNELTVRCDPNWIKSGNRDRDVRQMRADIEERTAMQIGNTGAYLAPTILLNKFVEKMVQFNRLRDFCNVFQTADGNSMTYPTFDDTANLATLVADENTDRNQTDITAGQGTFGASEINSDIALFSNKLLRDSYFDVESIAGAMLGRRIGRKQSVLYTTGTGSGQPQGVVTGASAGATAAGAAAITYGDIVNLMMSLDDAYDANAMFAFNKTSTLAALLKLAETTGKPLFGNLVDGAPRTLLGKPFMLLYSMANIATGNVSMLYGDFEEAVSIREVGDLIISRSTEYKWVKRQVALTADYAGDCRVVQSAALKKLTQA